MERLPSCGPVKPDAGSDTQPCRPQENAFVVNEPNWRSVALFTISCSRTTCETDSLLTRSLSAYEQADIACVTINEQVCLEITSDTLLDMQKISADLIENYTSSITARLRATSDHSYYVDQNDHNRKQIRRRRSAQLETLQQVQEADSHQGL